MIEITCGESNLTIPGTTKVTVKNFLQFTRGEEILGSLDAEFDFKDLPTNLHSLALQVIQMRGSNICIGMEWPPVKTAEPAQKKQSFWKKLFK